MIPKMLLPALNLLVMSPSIWVALAAGAGFVAGIYFERKNLYGSFTRPEHSRPTEPLSKQHPAGGARHSGTPKKGSPSAGKRRKRPSAGSN